MSIPPLRAIPCVTAYMLVSLPLSYTWALSLFNTRFHVDQCPWLSDPNTPLLLIYGDEDSMSTVSKNNAFCPQAWHHVHPIRVNLQDRHVYGMNAGQEQVKMRMSVQVEGVDHCNHASI